MIPGRQFRDRHAQGKPRASGDDPLPLWATPYESAVNPARAGMIPAAADREIVVRRKPRASGDDPWSAVS